MLDRSHLSLNPLQGEEKHISPLCNLTFKSNVLLKVQSPVPISNSLLSPPKAALYPHLNLTLEKSPKIFLVAISMDTF